MKKKHIIALALACILLLSVLLCACSDDGIESSAQSESNDVETTGTETKPPFSIDRPSADTENEIEGNNPDDVKGMGEQIDDTGSIGA